MLTSSVTICILLQLLQQKSPSSNIVITAASIQLLRK